MFAGLTKSRFYSKCKSLLKMTKTRLDSVKKKKAAVVKYLKNDMRDLIQTGMDYNAYCRAEGLLVEMDLLACYNYIEQFCTTVSTNLSLMDKQKECPGECQTAVQSLIYAAARFSEFPELRDLRAVLSERYGTSLEPFLNNEFVEKMKPRAATKEVKLQFMQEIAQEFSIEWNSKSLEQKLFQPPPSEKGQQRHGSIDSIGEDENRWRRSNSHQVQKKDRQDDSVTRSDIFDAGKKVHSMKEYTFPKMDGFTTCEGKKLNDNGHKHQSSSEDEVLSNRKDSSDQDSLHASTSSVGSVSEDEVDNKKPFYYRNLAPPYVRQKAEATKEEKQAEESPKSNGDSPAKKADRGDDSINGTRPKPRSVRRRPLRPPPGHEVFEKPLKPPPGHEVVEKPLKPPPGHETVEKPLRPPPGHEDAWSVETTLKLPPGRVRIASSATRVKQEEPKQQGLKIWQTDEKEKAIDGLLMHYSKKESPYELKPYGPPPSSQRNDDPAEPLSRRKSVPNSSGRSAESETPTKAKTKTHSRAVSLQPEMLGAGHVHPNMPEYDDLAARVASLRGR